MDIIEKEKRMFVAQLEVDNAIRAGNEYFENLVYSLNNILRDVESYQKRFKEEKTIDFLEWSVNLVKQLNSQDELAVRAAWKIAKATAVYELLTKTEEEEGE